MLSEKHLEIIHILNEKNDWVTSKHLANKLNISSRTVKSYVSFINDSTKDLIKSSSKGYLLDKIKYTQFKENILEEISLEDSSTTLPKNRSMYILNSLLFSNKYISIFELSEEILYVSVTTIRNDIQKLNEFLSPYRLKVCIKNNEISLIGHEKYKRKLISYLIFKEINAPLNIVSNVVNNSLGISIDEFKLEINTILNNNNQLINEVALENFVIHILVMVIRIKDKLPRANNDIQFKSGLADKIYHFIKEKFQIANGAISPEELELLIDSYINTHLPTNEQNLVSDEATQITNSLLKYIDSIYSLDLTNSSNFTSLMLHIESLIIRSKHNHQQKNHMTSIIKKESPMLFEIAVSAAHFIEQRLKTDLIEDEISLLALHISRIFNNEISIYRRINAHLINTSYLDNENRILNDLLNNFPNQLEISKNPLISDGDLIITTKEVSRDVYPTGNLVEISPFVTNNDIVKIQKEINRIINRRKKNRLKEILLQLTDEKRFYLNLNENNTIDLLSNMTENLILSSIVNPNFLDNVLKREELSSTVYEYFAIPHSVKPDANMTSLSILISEKPIDYFGRAVNLIILSTLNKNDMSLFHDFIELISESLLDFESIDRLRYVKNLDDFITILTT